MEIFPNYWIIPISDSISFKKTIENFTCYNCGVKVNGNGYTDHCPNCLYGKHVDISPGDRKNTCQGILKPISTVYKNGSIIIFYKCQKCNQIKNFKAANNDNQDLLESLLTNK